MLPFIIGAEYLADMNTRGKLLWCKPKRNALCFIFHSYSSFVII